MVPSAVAATVMAAFTMASTFNVVIIAMIFNYYLLKIRIFLLFSCGFQYYSVTLHSK